MVEKIRGIRCPWCSRQFKTQQSITNHSIDKHGKLWPWKYESKDQRVADDMEWANSQMTIGEEQDFGA